MNNEKGPPNMPDFLQLLREWTLITIDKNGITVGQPRALISWSEILACARKNDDKTQILRIFLYSIPATASTVKYQAQAALGDLTRSASRNSQSDTENYLDIHFDEVEEPKQSLAKAFEACVEWIVSTRTLSETDNPIRAFIEPSRLAGPEKNIGYWLTWTRDFDIGFLVIPLLVISIFGSIFGFLLRP